jgi:5-methylthioadenosine/S-adenosylhomocysteine deaminase
MSRFLLQPRWIVPVDPPGQVLERHVVAVRDGRIEALLPAAEAAGRFASYETLDLPDHVLIPGLVNAHTHAAMSLMRGLADDLPLTRWLEDHIWPAEGKHVSAAMVRTAPSSPALRCCAAGSLLQRHVFFPEASLEAARGAGMRVALGIIVFEFPSAHADAADTCEGPRAARPRGEDPLVSFCLARTRRTRVRRELPPGGEARGRA